MHGVQSYNSGQSYHARGACDISSRARKRFELGRIKPFSTLFKTAGLGLLLPSRQKPGIRNAPHISHPFESSRKLRLLRQFSATLQTAGLGLEPRYTPPEGVVLPLDDPAITVSSSVAFSLGQFCKTAPLQRLRICRYSPLSRLTQTAILILLKKPYLYYALEIFCLHWRYIQYRDCRP